ncbi:hypothetical protein C0584_05085 [Candidatus Parcubacteria bacterium]|nr:MAG: hypothetical protein C0584_05085 [Candidatus Parcubacteria bacterium]
MKKFLLTNKIYLPISLLLVLMMTFGAYFVEADFSIQKEEGGQVLGISEEYREESSRNFLPTAEDRIEYSEDFFDLENFPQKIYQEETPDYNSGSVYIYSPSSDYVFVDKNSKNIQAIASITKLMTALVFLENNPGWENIYELKREDRVEGGRIYLYLGDKVRIIDLFNLSLVASANTATKALANSTGMTEEEFVAKMNEKAQELGMTNTNYVDPIGISSFNVSNARDLAILLQEVLENEDIRNTVTKKEYYFKTVEGVSKIAYSTDNLLSIYPKEGVELLGGKTGYIEAAGFCFAGIFKNHDGREVVSVVLGADDPLMRFNETDDLVSWVYDNFLW